METQIPHPYWYRTFSCGLLLLVVYELVFKFFFYASTKSLVPLRPFPSSLLPPFRNESTCETFHMKMSSACGFIFMQIKVIFIRMVSHLNSLWDRSTRVLGNGVCLTFIHGFIVTCSLQAFSLFYCEVEVLFLILCVLCLASIGLLQCFSPGSLLVHERFCYIQRWCGACFPSQTYRSGLWRVIPLTPFSLHASVLLYWAFFL